MAKRLPGLYTGSVAVAFNQEEPSSQCTLLISNTDHIAKNKESRNDLIINGTFINNVSICEQAKIFVSIPGRKSVVAWQVASV